MRIRVVALVLVLLVLLVPAGCGQPDAQVATSPTSTATAQPVAAVASIGAVFLGDGPVHSCTGSIVHSRTGDLVLTAAHCLANGVNAVFVPGFADTAVPVDNWHLDTVYLDPRWVSAQDPLADFAIARVSRAAGGSIEAVSGAALTLGSAPGAGTAVSVTGYPFGEGGGAVGCSARTDVVETYPVLRCTGLVDGTSGAPWVNGTTVTGVTGGREAGGCDGDVSYSSPFDGAVAALLTRAEASGPGDAAPDTYSADC
jgi:V8-like Glu-specific endopeptidase